MFENVCTIILTKKLYLPNQLLVISIINIHLDGEIEIFLNFAQYLQFITYVILNGKINEMCDKHKLIIGE